MPHSNFPGGFAQGVTIRGLPLTVAHPGEMFWVDGSSVSPPRGVSSGSDSQPGTFNRPVSTIAAAFDLCTASRGDIIVVKPGYTETVATATALAFDVAGVALVGLGTGSLKPTLSFSATGSEIVIAVANLSAYNIRFVASIANITNCLDITGTDCTIDYCEFLSDTATACFLKSVSTTGAAIGTQITHCFCNQETTIDGSAVTDVAQQAFQINGDNSAYNDNVIMGEFSTAAIASSTANLSTQICRNYIYNGSTAAAAGGISLAASSNGIIYENRICSLETSAIAGLIVNQGAAMAENYAVNVITETAGLVGTAST